MHAWRGGGLLLACSQALSLQPCDPAADPASCHRGLPSCPAGSLALRWRQRLTSHLHWRYCSGHAFYTLHQQQQQQQEQQTAADATHNLLAGQQAADGGPGVAVDKPPLFQQPQGGTRESPSCGKPLAAGGGDNPDQRIASDAAALCEDLAEVAKVAAAAPFKLLYYRRAHGPRSLRRARLGAVRSVPGSSSTFAGPARCVLVHRLPPCTHPALSGLPASTQLADVGLPRLAGAGSRLRLLLGRCPSPEVLLHRRGRQQAAGTPGLQTNGARWQHMHGDLAAKLLGHKPRAMLRPGAVLALPASHHRLCPLPSPALQAGRGSREPPGVPPGAAGGGPPLFTPAPQVRGAPVVWQGTPAVAGQRAAFASASQWRMEPACAAAPLSPGTGASEAASPASKSLWKRRATLRRCRRAAALG